MKRFCVICSAPVTEKGDVWWCSVEHRESLQELKRIRAAEEASLRAAEEEMMSYDSVGMSEAEKARQALSGGPVDYPENDIQVDPIASYQLILIGCSEICAMASRQGPAEALKASGLALDYLLRVREILGVGKAV